MIKLNKYVEGLEKILTRIEEKKEFLGNKMDEIEENASRQHRDLTAEEDNQIAKYSKQFDKLDEEFEDINSAIKCLSNYCVSENAQSLDTTGRIV